MRRIPAALVLLLLLGKPTPAEDPRLDLTEARVLASPGLPAALLPFLPSSHTPEPFRWPLPDGPLLLVGLPETDRAAREIAEALGVIAPDEDLAGGYVVAAWRSGTRPIAVLLGDDPAALHAARFEIESLVPTDLGDRTQEVTGETHGARTCVGCGRRVVRPAWRTRTLLVREDPAGDVALRAAGAHANRVALARGSVPPQRLREIAERARFFGIDVVGYDAGRLPVALAGIRLLPEPAGATTPTGTTETLLSARDGRAPTLEEARREAGPGGADASFLETAGDPISDPSVGPPAMPPARDPRLGEALSGIVVPDGPLAGAILERAWDPDAPGPPGPLEAILPYVPVEPLAPEDLLARTAASLRAALAGARGEPWMRAWAETLEVVALPDPPRVLLVPTVPVTVTADGHLDERAWAHAVTFRLHDMTGLAVSDGRSLHLAARWPVDRALREFSVSVAGPGDAWSGLSVWGNSAVPLAPRGPHTVLLGRTDGTAEATLTPAALGGDAFPTRVLRLTTHARHGQHTAGWAGNREAVLVIGR